MIEYCDNFENNFKDEEQIMRENKNYQVNKKLNLRVYYNDFLFPFFIIFSSEIILLFFFYILSIRFFYNLCYNMFNSLYKYKYYYI